MATIIKKNVWNRVSDILPQTGLKVMTKIDDENGVRNVQRLKREGGLWLTEDGKMYVYYTPTHWMSEGI